MAKNEHLLWTSGAIILGVVLFFPSAEETKDLVLAPKHAQGTTASSSGDQAQPAAATPSWFTGFVGSNRNRPEGAPVGYRGQGFARGANATAPGQRKPSLTFVPAPADVFGEQADYLTKRSGCPGALNGSGQCVRR